MRMHEKTNILANPHRSSMGRDHTGKTVSSVVAGSMRAGAERCGFDPEQFLVVTGMGQSEIADVSQRIGGAKYLKALHLLERLGCSSNFKSEVFDSLNNLTALGSLHAAFPEAAALWVNCPSARSALRSYLAYRSLIGQIDSLSLRERPDGLELTHVNEPGAPGSSLGALAKFLRRIGNLSSSGPAARDDHA